jgi:hypothetical protein
MKIQNQVRGAGVLSTLLLLGFAACSDEVSDPIVGSEHVVESSTKADVVQKVTVSLPFRVEVGNGEPKKLLLRGEDNLIGQIAVEETAVGEWRISAPQNLAFTQHGAIEVAIPYVDMVLLALDGDDIQLTDRPEDFWHEGEPTDG